MEFIRNTIALLIRLGPSNERWNVVPPTRLLPCCTNLRCPSRYVPSCESFIGRPVAGIVPSCRGKSPGEHAPREFFVRSVPLEKNPPPPLFSRLNHFFRFESLLRVGVRLRNNTRRVYIYIHIYHRYLDYGNCIE